MKKNKNLNDSDKPLEELGADCPAEDEVAEDTCDEQGEREAECERTVEDELREELETATKQRDEFRAVAQRAQADYINFKRRNQTARVDAYDDGVREVIASLLPVLDTLDRAIASIDESAIDSMSEGFIMTRRQLLDALAKAGLEEVPALNEPFDPELHNAVMRVSEGEPGTVLEVFEKGYRVKGRIIRYAMVKVAAE